MNLFLLLPLIIVGQMAFAQQRPAAPIPTPAPPPSAAGGQKDTRSLEDKKAALEKYSDVQIGIFNQYKKCVSIAKDDAGLTKCEGERNLANSNEMKNLRQASENLQHAFGNSKEKTSASLAEQQNKANQLKNQQNQSTIHLTNQANAQKAQAAAAVNQNVNATQATQGAQAAQDLAKNKAQSATAATSTATATATAGANDKAAAAAQAQKDAAAQAAQAAQQQNNQVQKNLNQANPFKH